MIIVIIIVINNNNRNDNNAIDVPRAMLYRRRLRNAIPLVVETIVHLII